MSKFISLNYESGKKCCFEIKAILFNPDLGIVISGPKDIYTTLTVYVYFKGGKVKMESDSRDGKVAIKSCRIANCIFSQCDGDVKDKKIIKLKYDNGFERTLTLEDLYEELLSVMLG